MSAKLISPIIAVALLSVTGAVHAQAGIGVQPGATPTGTIGTNKGDPGSGAMQCPAGTVVRGAYHRDKAMSGVLSSTRGMSNRVGLYCGGIVTDGVTVSVVNRNPNGTPDLLSFGYASPGTERTGYCPANQVVHQFGGWDREWSNGQYPPWSSSLNLVCRPLTLNANSWVRMTTGASTSVEVGVRETAFGLPAHVSRGPFCTNSATTLNSGLFLQAGGEGWDGINVYCGTFRQARHSAVMTFTDFSWSQALGGSGWLVDLNQGTTLLDNGAGMSGANRTPHASTAVNTSVFQNGNEVYVLPGSNYRASVSQRPAAVDTNSYLQTGNCLSGISLSNEQDASCTLNIQGLPDIAVAITTPAPAYGYYGEEQSVTVTATNVGPGATDGDDGFTLVTTLPTGWTAGTLPANCSANGGGTVVTCALNPTPLAGSPAPGSNGGTVAFTFPVTVNSPTASGTYTANLQLGRSVPDGDSDATNNDFNTANDSASGPLVFEQQPTLALAKTWVSAATGDIVTLSATGGSGNPVLSSTADGADETDTGSAVLMAVGDVVTLGETLGASNAGSYDAGAWSCTGGSLSGNTLTLGSGDIGAAIVCTITNTRRQSDIQVVKSASPDPVISGQVVTWTIVASNNGPSDTADVQVSDTPGPGQDCIAPGPAATCSASGGASCPGAMVAVADLIGAGITIPSLPVGGSVTIVLQCEVTASGL